MKNETLKHYLNNSEELTKQYDSKNTVCFRIKNICSDPRRVDVVTCIVFDY